MAQCTMKLKTYYCKNKNFNGKACPNKIKGFASRKDPKATLSKDRPRCGKCGKRV